MQDMRGKLKRRLVALSLDTLELPAAGAPVTSPAGEGSETVGEVTSAALSPLTGKAVALARLKGPYFEGKLPLVLAGKSAAFVEQSAPE
jgi:glycine cleavage system aminomethyltransferase T